MTTALASPVARPLWRGAAPWASVLVAALACFFLLFRAEATAAVGVWLTSTAYGHCFFVLPIALWLAWERRAAASGLAPAPTPWPALAVLPCALAWFAAERLGLMEGRQLAALGMLEALLVALLGWRLARVFAAPLLYLVFLVPFGSFLVPTLQGFTARFVDAGLELLAIPHVVDAFTIEIPEGMFYVAVACAGLRFLIAAVAFGVLYACTVYRSPGKRLAFVAASCVVPVVANGVRALGIVVAAHLVGSAQAVMADHIIYGWGFFSLVIVLLTLAGLPFRDDMRAPVPGPGRAPAGAAPPPAGRAVAAAVTVTLLAALAPAAAMALDRARPAPSLDLPAFAASADCTPAAPQAAGTAIFTCHGLKLTATLAVLPAGSSPAALRAARAHATGEQDAAEAVTSTLHVDAVRPRDWRLVELRDPDRLTATATWIDGDPDPGGMAGRLRQAWDSVAGGGAPPVLLAASLNLPGPLPPDRQDGAQRLLAGFLRAQAPLLAAVTQAAGR
jgi:exosortase A